MRHRIGRYVVSAAALLTAAACTVDPSANATPQSSGPLKMPADRISGPYSVTRIVDGDTIWIDQDGRRTKVRLTGLDTPEVKDPATVSARAQGRRTARESACKYYTRAGEWFRQARRRRVLREHALAESHRLREELDRENAPEAVRGHDDVVEPIEQLAHRVDQIIAETIADFGGEHLKQLSNRSSRELIRTLSHVMQVLTDPYAASLRSDLAPVTFGHGGQHATQPLDAAILTERVRQCCGCWSLDR